MKKSHYNAWVFFVVLICSCNDNTNIPDNINTRASFPDSGKFSTAGLKLITSFVNKKAGTMSTLYGNALALQKSKDLNAALVGGETFTLVTCKQQHDEHWFGAKIPGDLQSVEVLKANPGGSQMILNYQRYEGKELILNPDTSYSSERIKFMLAQRAAVMP
jgi:hypothetical protein